MKAPPYSVLVSPDLGAGKAQLQRGSLKNADVTTVIRARQEVLQFSRTLDSSAMSFGPTLRRLWLVGGRTLRSSSSPIISFAVGSKPSW